MLRAKKRRTAPIVDECKHYRNESVYKNINNNEQIRKTALCNSNASSYRRNPIIGSRKTLDCPSCDNNKSGRECKGRICIQNINPRFSIKCTNKAQSAAANINDYYNYDTKQYLTRKHKLFDTHRCRELTVGADSGGSRINRLKFQTRQEIHRPPVSHKEYIDIIGANNIAMKQTADRARARVRGGV